MSIKEQVVHDLEVLSETELKRVADYVAFLKFQERLKQRSLTDEAALAARYAEFADEDRSLTEEGMSDYAAGLASEDHQ